LITRALRSEINLYSFLCTFQKGDAVPDRAVSTDVEYLYIDQICIDQSNLPERNIQVLLMADIYSRSTLVFVWLGWAPEMVKAARESVDSIWDMNELWFPESAVTVLLSNSYFTRVWIVQEVSPARKIWILCGDVETAWDGLQISVRQIDPWKTGNHHLSIIRALFIEKGKREDRRLDEVAKRYSVQECQDPRDKIYGFLGMVSADQRPVIDYAKSVQQVYADAVLTVLGHYWNNRFKRYKTEGPFQGGLRIYIENMIDLAWNMKLPERDQRGLVGMFREIVEVEDQLRQWNKEPPLSMTDVIEGLGYVATADPSIADGSEGLLTGQWWVDVCGEKQYFDCITSSAPLNKTFAWKFIGSIGKKEPEPAKQAEGTSEKPINLTELNDLADLDDLWDSEFDEESDAELDAIGKRQPEPAKQAEGTSEKPIDLTELDDLNDLWDSELEESDVEGL
jgi:heterokaryon incompatibility protein (HET)